MIMHPALIALSAGSLIVAFMMVYAAANGVRILRYWDLTSGSELQLRLERKVYLISTIMSYAFCFQLFSLFLFIFTADRLASLFTGAMCAAGTLNVNDYGYPTLLFKIVNSILGGVWLIVNYTDNMAVDYPLTRRKYLLLISMTPLILIEVFLQGSFLIHLNAHVITSCCGSLFSPENSGVGAAITALPFNPTRLAFFVGMVSTLFFGVLFLVARDLKTRTVAGYLFSLASIATFVISVAALISFISLYIYELPTHHCPFCILQKEYYYVGYLLYLCLLGAVVSAAALGVLIPFSGTSSLRTTLPPLQNRLTVVTLTLYFIFTVTVSSFIIFTDFRL